MSSNGPDDLAARVSRLGSVVELLEARVAALEGADAAGLASTPAPLTETAEEVEDLRSGASHALFLLGRSILLLAGAFLLRALTEGGTLPPLAGFGAGVVFALAILLLADRAGQRGDTGSTVAFGLTAALVAYPLLLETTGISSLVPPAAGAGALAIITAAGFVVAGRARARLLAGVFTLAATATAVILMFALGAPLLFNVVLLTIGVGTLLLAYMRGWRLERWLPALVTNALILRLVIMAADTADPAAAADRPAPGAVMALALALLLVYLGIFTFRTLVQGKGARVFYVIQSTAVLLIGYGGAVRVADAGVGGGALLGWLALAAAAGYYFAAFTVVRQKHGRGEGFYYSALLGLVLLVLGSRVVVPAAVLGWIWLGLGVAAALLAARFDRASLRGHCAVYVAAAGMQTGLFAATWDAFLAGADVIWRTPGAGAVATTALAAGCYVLLASTRRNPGALSALDRLPRFGVVLTALAGAGALVVSLLVRVTGVLGADGSDGPAAPEAASATIAVIRTVVLAATAVGLAWQARHITRRELGWLVYPLLVLGLVKLLVQDLRHGSPLTLTLGFAAFGAALIVAPRLLLKGRDAAGD